MVVEPDTDGLPLVLEDPFVVGLSVLLSRHLWLIVNKLFGRIFISMHMAALERRVAEGFVPLSGCKSHVDADCGNGLDQADLESFPNLC